MSTARVRGAARDARDRVARDWQQRNKRIADALAERQKSVDAMTRVIVDLQAKNADRHFVITVLREEIEVLDKQIANIRKGAA